MKDLVRLIKLNFGYFAHGETWGVFCALLLECHIIVKS